ncbi:MAG: hypothetical protein ACRCV3_03495 [Desulfovibrionaceae bacterium]
MSQDIEHKNKKEKFLTQGIAETSSIHIPGYESSSVRGSMDRVSVHASSVLPTVYTLLCSIDRPLDIGFSIEHATLLREKESLLLYLLGNKIVRVDNFFSFRGLLPEIVIGGTIIITGEELLSLYAPSLLKQYKEEVRYFENKVQHPVLPQATDIGVETKVYDIRLLDNNVRSSFWNTIEFDPTSLDIWEYESKASIYFRPIYNPPIIVHKEINPQNTKRKSISSSLKAKEKNTIDEKEHIPIIKCGEEKERCGKGELEKELASKTDIEQKELSSVSTEYLQEKRLSFISSEKENTINNKVNYDDSLPIELEKRTWLTISSDEKEHKVVNAREILIGNIYKDSNHEALWNASLRVVDIFYRGEQKILGISWKGLYGTMCVSSDGSYRYELSETVLFEDIRETLFETFEARIMDENNTLSSATVFIEIVTEKGRTTLRRVRANESYYRLGQSGEFLCITGTILNPSSEDILYFDGITGIEGIVEYNKTLRQLSAKNYKDIEECEASVARIILDTQLSLEKYTRFVVITVDGYATGGAYYGRKMIYAVIPNEKGRTYVTACEEAFFPEIQTTSQAVLPEFQRRKYTSMYTLSGNVYKESKVLCNEKNLEIAKIFYKGQEKKIAAHWQSEYANVIVHENGDYEYVLQEKKRASIASKPIFDIIECSFLDSKGEYRVSHLIAEIIVINDVVQIRRLESDESYYQTDGKTSLSVTTTVLNPSKNDTLLLTPLCMGSAIPLEYNSTLKQLSFRNCEVMSDCEAMLQNIILDVGDKEGAFHTRYILLTIDGYGREGVYYSSRKVYAIPISEAKEYKVILGEEVEEAVIHEKLFSSRYEDESASVVLHYAKKRIHRSNEDVAENTQQKTADSIEENEAVIDSINLVSEDTNIIQNTFEQEAVEEELYNHELIEDRDQTKDMEGILSEDESTVFSENISSFDERVPFLGFEEDPEADVYNNEMISPGQIYAIEDNNESELGYTNIEKSLSSAEDFLYIQKDELSEREWTIAEIQEEERKAQIESGLFLMGENGVDTVNNIDEHSKEENNIYENTVNLEDIEQERFSSEMYANGIMKLYTQDVFVLGNEKQALRIGGTGKDTVILLGEGWKQVKEEGVNSRYYLQGAFYKHYIATSGRSYRSVFIADEIKIENG